MTNEECYRKTDMALSRRMPDGITAIFRMDEFDFIYEIDRWAAEYWNLVDGERSQYELSKVIAKKSGFEQKAVSELVQGLTEKLVKFNLLERVSLPGLS